MYLNNRKGMAVPLVLMIVVVLLLLGTALMHFSTADALQVARDHKKMQAHYLARSGADVTASWIINDASEEQMEDMFPESVSSDTSLGGGKFNVRVTGHSGGPIIVQSKGETGGVSDNVTLALKQMGLFDNAIWAKGDLDFRGNVEIEGSVESAGTVIVDGSANITGGVMEDSKRDYPEPVFPFTEAVPPSDVQGLDDYGSNNLSINKNQLVEINNNYEFDTISVNGTLLFKGDNLKAYINNITVNNGGRVEFAGDNTKWYIGSITVKNGGELEFEGDGMRLSVNSFINNDATIISGDGVNASINTLNNGGLLTFYPAGNGISVLINTKINNKEMSIFGDRLNLFINTGAEAYFSDTVEVMQPQNFIISLKQNAYLELPGNSVFFGFIYGPNATIDLHGTPGFTGAIIGNIVSTVGNTAVAYSAEGAENILPDDLPLGTSSLGYMRNYYQ